MTRPGLGETRYDYIGPIRVMAFADNYLMVRRPHCMPWVMRLSDWHKLGQDPAIVGKAAAPRAMHYGVLA